MGLFKSILKAAEVVATLPFVVPIAATGATVGLLSTAVGGALGGTRKVTSLGARSPAARSPVLTGPPPGSPAAPPAYSVYFQEDPYRGEFGHGGTNPNDYNGGAPWDYSTSAFQTSLIPRTFQPAAYSKPPQTWEDKFSVGQLLPLALAAFL